MMKERIISFGSWLRGLSAVSFIAVCSAIMFGLNVTSGLIIERLGIEVDPQNMLDFKNDALYLALSSLIKAPLVETFLFQMVMFWLLRKIKWLDRHKIYIMLISGVVFGSMHWYSPAYIVVASVLGIFFMFFYITRFRKGAYWCVAAVHAIVNLIAFSMNYIAVNY